MNLICIYSSCRDDSSFKLNTLGPLCLWQCLYFYKRWFYVSIKAYCLDHPIYWFLCFYKSQSIKSSKHLGIMGVDTTRIWTPCLRILPRNQATTSKNLTKWLSKACPILLPVCFASFREVSSLVPHVLEMGVETGCCQNLAGSCNLDWLRIKSKHLVHHTLCLNVLFGCII